MVNSGEKFPESPNTIAISFNISPGNLKLAALLTDDLIVGSSNKVGKLDLSLSVEDVEVIFKDD